MMQSEAAIRILCEQEQISPADTEMYSKLKFSYVVACQVIYLMIYICNFHVSSNLLLIYTCKLHWNQVYGQMKKNLEHKADDIEFLLARYPNLRIAYIDSVRSNREGKLLMIYICNFHVLSNLPLIYICKLHWNLNTMFVCQVNSF